MVTGVVTVRPEDSVASAVKALVRHRLDGILVVDRTGQLLGLLSGPDLVVRQSRQHVPIGDLVTPTHPADVA